MTRLLALLLGFHTLTATAATCPAPDELDRYVTTPLRAEAPMPAQGQIRVRYRLFKPFDPAKPTVLIVPGGPGGDHSIVYWFGFLADDYNVLSFDHRGLGCTKVTTPLNPSYEQGIYGMSRAADDLEAIRKDLLGEEGHWFVYGVSYGGMLAQKYAIKYPSRIRGLVLDSTMHDTRGVTVGRNQYVKLFIENDRETNGLFQQILEKDPEARPLLLRKIFGQTYSYSGRSQGIKRFLRGVLSAGSVEEMRKRYRMPAPEPLVGMQASIMCEEIWDYPAQADDFYMPDMEISCRPYRPFRNPMAWAGELRRLPVKTMIWGGAFDPVTPAQMTREIQSLIPGSFMYQNNYAGHGLIGEKFNCAKGLLAGFLGGASENDIGKYAVSMECQSPPSLGVLDVARQMAILTGVTRLPVIDELNGVEVPASLHW